MADSQDQDVDMEKQEIGDKEPEKPELEVLVVDGA
jgi:hypothetical protein